MSFLFKTGDFRHVPGKDRLVEKEDAHARTQPLVVVNRQLECGYDPHDCIMDIDKSLSLVSEMGR